MEQKMNDICALEQRCQQSTEGRYLLVILFFYLLDALS